MTDVEETRTPTTKAGGPVDQVTNVRLRWWFEIVAIGAMYVVYSGIRNNFGSATVSPDHAFNNARRIITAERKIGLYFEENLQDVFLGQKWFLQFWNVFYGTFHFWVTAFALIYTYRKRPEVYSFWRNAIIFATAFALIGFSLFPLMPPRLLDDCGEFGACVSYGFVDTLAQFGGLWSFDSGAMEKISNQYAAMPSLHFAWSFWTFLVLYRHLKHRWSRIAIALYPWVTVFAIMVTANHFWLDAAGGALVLAAGIGLSWTLRWASQRFRGRSRPQPDLAPA
jgi:PAP2 superfamily